MSDKASLKFHTTGTSHSQSRLPRQAKQDVLVRVVILCLLLLVKPAAAEDSPEAIRDLLLSRNAEFEPTLIRVADGVYTSVGQGVSAVSMVDTNDGLIIVDTGIDLESAKKVIDSFREITAKPVIAIVLTHGHGDHTGGFSAFYAEGDAPAVIVARDFGREQKEFQDAGLSIQKNRGAMQAGFLLSRDQRINNGIARAYWPKRGGKAFEAGTAIEPTIVISEPSQELTFGDSKLSFHLAPGETKDQMFVVVHDRSVLFAGDNFYKSWPNIYAIRGTSYRDLQLWIQSLTAMMTYQSDALVGGHTRPIIGSSVVSETLTNYRDALQSLFSQTIDGINQGLTPDELVDYVQLPDHLTDLDYLKPYYGHPEWAIRSIFNGYLGWFDGNPTSLFPLNARDEAERMAKLAGGEDALFVQANSALEQGDAQWAAQLADHLLAINDMNLRAREIKAEALEILAEGVLTTTARNYYFSSALKLRQGTRETIKPEEASNE